MVESALLSPAEKRILRCHRKGSKSLLLRDRAHAVLLYADGYSVYETARILFRSEKTVREWIKAFHQTRIASIFPKYYDNQNAAKLNQKQKEQIKRVLQNPPGSYGLPESFWSINPLKQYIHAEFGVEYQSPESYRLIFKLCDFSFHLPAKFNLRRNEKLIAGRMAEIRQEIKPWLNDSSREVLVADESRIIWETILRRAWLPQGQKTVIKTTQSRKAQNFLGFLNLKTGKPHLFPIPWQNQIHTLKALKALKAFYPKKKVCLIWDNARWHKGLLIRLHLRKRQALYHFHLINLPPYAPDMNPQEKVWKYAKEKIANKTYGSLEQTAADFVKIVMGRNYHYQI